MAKKNLIIFPQYKCEFNAWARLNAFIFKVRQLDIYEKITVVSPTKTASIVQLADDFISCAEHILDSFGENYPNLHHWEDKLKAPSQFHSRVRRYLENNPRENTDVITMTPYTLDNAPLQLLELYSVPQDQYMQALNRDWKFLAELSESGYLINPTKEAYDKMSDEYPALFPEGEKNYIIITRESQLSACHNTSKYPQIEENIKGCLAAGINIINIGFPAYDFNIDDPRYARINAFFTQDDLMALFKMSSGVLLYGGGGGYIVHSMCEVDIFLTVHDFGEIMPVRVDLSEVRMKNKSVNTVHLYGKDKSYAEILLSTEKKHTVEKFAETKPILYV